MMTKDESPVRAPSPDSPAMEHAMANARVSFKYLWRELTWEYRRIVPALDLAAVKLAFLDPGGAPEEVEHMWLSQLGFDGDVIVGTLLNAPHRLRSVKQGDEVAFGLAQLEDWLYAMNGQVYGGYTMQVIRAAMSASERQAHDEAWGFTFADPARVELVPDWREKKPSLLGRVFGGKPSLVDPDQEHPMSQNMAAKFGEAIDANPHAFLRDSDESGITTLHSLALGGSTACVKVLLQKGANPHARTVSGRTARDLAEALGWSEVASVLCAAERAS